MSSCLLDCFEFSGWHTAETLAEKLVAMLQKIGKWKRQWCTIDNAANIRRAIQITELHHKVEICNPRMPLSPPGLPQRCQAEEWNILQEVCTVLEPFNAVTVEISVRYLIPKLIVCQL